MAFTHATEAQALATWSCIPGKALFPARARFLSNCCSAHLRLNPHCESSRDGSHVTFVTLHFRRADDTDIVLTHGPPYSIADWNCIGIYLGSKTLHREILGRVKPKFHVFGHIHEAYGAWKHGLTVFINASVCSIGFEAERPPIIFDLPERK